MDELFFEEVHAPMESIQPFEPSKEENIQI